MVGGPLTLDLSSIKGALSLRSAQYCDWPLCQFYRLTSNTVSNSQKKYKIELLVTLLVSIKTSVQDRSVVNKYGC